MGVLRPEPRLPGPAPQLTALHLAVYPFSMEHLLPGLFAFLGLKYLGWAYISEVLTYLEPHLPRMLTSSHFRRIIAVMDVMTAPAGCRALSPGEGPSCGSCFLNKVRLDLSLF